MEEERGKMRLGLVGLPSVEKKTLFELLTGQAPNGDRAHLFVRQTKMSGKRAGSSIYCGEVEFGR